MSDVVLTDHDRWLMRWVFSPEKGVIVDGPTLALAHGWFVRSHVGQGKGSWSVAAAYEQDGCLWFQIDQRRWDLELATLSHSHSPDGTLCTFTVSLGDTAVFEDVYVSHRLDPLNQADPSFDALDEENEDFFIWATRNASTYEERASAAQFWRTGFKLD